MAEDTPAFDKLNNTINQLKTNQDESRTEELKNQFWNDAVNWWDEEMSGDVTLADGRTVHIPKINEK